MITILTPTYNRAYILHEAFKSLCKQSSFDFEWIIVDDGSTDNTEEIVREWINADLPFKITYRKQENGGKHRAVNVGVKLAQYNFILILDSDDYLTDTAVSTINHWISEIKDDASFAGVAGLRGYINSNKPIGHSLSKEYIDATNIERYKYKLMGDKAEIYRTELLIKYPFPEFEGENFLRESAVWDKIAQEGYKIRWHNKIIYMCEYLEDGLTKKADLSRYKNNFQGFTYCTKLCITAYPFKIKYLNIGNYANIARNLGYSNQDICKMLDINNLQIMIGKFVYKVNNIRKAIKR